MSTPKTELTDLDNINKDGWRPEDWENIVRSHYPSAFSLIFPDAEERRQINDFELGADAILQYLLDCGIMSLEVLEALNIKGKEGGIIPPAIIYDT